ncbi:helix-turn-helix domain-containing protein [Amphiplicatus metriothermophilus]|uniref:Transcriptional regulator n=1 Tax=Amphiplicatus metriothermophilus TaxID=1519374 RepID=A0A239PKN8_9PROT|nr:helix-turn-helix transcriptional regulator [Amphiplicatus metriothermophilus]MBB5517545.1 transcriptional regulator with XRE-family HTH domain [Amphiplicatus metriothermophilus]SNT68120.1 transcriptional regulator [Amphiplicatus metriothermophilus]
MGKKSPHPIDVHVGARVRLRRMMLGMSQDKLGEALGLTFQQVQKYEKGVNRIGASRVFELSRILEVPIQYFFDDFDGAGGSAYGFAEGESGDDSFMKVLQTPEGVQLCRHFFEIRDPKVRRRVLDLVKTLADGEKQDAPEKG